VLLGEQDVAKHGAGYLAPALAFGREGKAPVIECQSPAKLLQVACQVRLGPGPLRPVGFERGLEGFAQLVQGRQVVGGQPGWRASRARAASCSPMPGPPAGRPRAGGPWTECSGTTAHASVTPAPGPLRSAQWRDRPLRSPGVHPPAGRAGGTAAGGVRGPGDLSGGVHDR
jgi:hypothetical protein